MSLHALDIRELYEDQLINEMREGAIEALLNVVDMNNLPFDNIFGSNIRLVIPMVSDATFLELKQLLSNIKNYAGIDTKTGKVIRKIKLDPKYGGGEKTQEISIGKALQGLSDVDPEKKQKLLDWYALYKDNMENVSDDYVMIVSRSPVDIIRMSDRKQLESCHSVKGSHYPCAVQEAMSGGGVAFVVDSRDYERFIEDGGDINDQDILIDDDRDLYGSTYLEPITRVRFRRLDSKEDRSIEIALPEEKLYGDQTIPYVYETLKAFLKEKQPEFNTDKYKQTNHWTYRGGHYEDTYINQLLRSYLEDDYFNTVNVLHDADDYASERYDTEEIIRKSKDDLNELIKNVIDRYDEFKFMDVSYWVDEDNEYVDVTAEGYIDLTPWKDVFTKYELFDWDNIHDIKSVMEYDYDDSDYDENDEYVSSFAPSTLVGWLDRLVSDYDMMLYEVQLNMIKDEGYDSYIRFKATVNENTLIRDKDDFSEFYDHVDDLDRNLKSMTSDEFNEILLESKIINKEPFADLKSRLKQLKNYKPFDNGIQGKHYLTFPKTANLDRFELRIAEHNIGNLLFNEYLPVHIARNFKRVKPVNNQMELNLTENNSITPDRTVKELYFEYDIESFYINIDTNNDHYGNPVVTVELKFYFDKNTITEDNVNFSEQIDRSIIDINNMLKIIIGKKFENLVDRDDQKIRNTYRGIF